MQIAENPPRSIAELEALSVSGISKLMKMKHGGYLVAGVRQADAHLALVQAGSAALDDFVLDVDMVFKGHHSPPNAAAGQQQHPQNQGVHAQQPLPCGQSAFQADWGDDDDDFEWDGEC